MTETLTAYERAELEGEGTSTTEKALRIINALTAANARIAELEAAHERALNERDAAHNALDSMTAARDSALELAADISDQRDAANARADAAERFAKLWKRKAGKARRLFHSYLDMVMGESGRAVVARCERAEAEAAALRAEVERLKAAVDSANRIGEKYQEMFRAERAQLAAANALLDGATDAVDEACYPVWWEQYRAYLAGQSAAPEGEPK